ncbi:uncharacterized protein LOC107982089 [Nasonia vitripennis]|uniref:Uncharacterized protein n=1 Tax=Nasonia vitripennis TaxID=7425 RepID=A0A7M7Q3L4_NASVI|nr:uncharacterized protein LOC107982089 [Nasonia vitripennis]
MDFSENYMCKYSTEVHSVHFGASRQQVTLHTGMFYSESFSNGFATASESLRHDAVAVLAHVFDILDHFLSDLPFINTVNFKSDGPTNQYKNKTLFFLITQVLPQRYAQIRKITYNYSESGHGKGPADGIGGALKRLADDQVKYGRDVSNFDAFLSIIKEKSKKIYISSITEVDISKVENQVSNEIKCYNGTRQMYQFTWRVENSTKIYFNKLSCLICLPGEKCRHFFLGTMEYMENAAVPVKEKPKVQEKKIKKDAIYTKETTLNESTVATTASLSISSRRSSRVPVAKSDDQYHFY